MKKILVNTGSRIHINSLDMNGASGSCCGGVGIYLEKPDLEMVVKFNKHMDVPSVK